MTEIIEMPGRTLEQHVAELATQGYVTATRTEHTAQLVRKKKFSLPWAALWFVSGFGVGVLAYLGYYMAKKDDFAYLNDEAGYVRGTVQYSRPRYGLVALSYGIYFASFVPLFGGTESSVALALVMWVVSVIALAASLFGWRRTVEIGREGVDEYAQSHRDED